MPEQAFVDLNEISSEVSTVSLKFDTTQCEEYQRTMDATDALLAAREVTGQARTERLKTALSALQDAWPAVPDALEADWQDCIDALQGRIDG